MRDSWEGMVLEYLSQINDQLAAIRALLEEQGGASGLSRDAKGGP